MLGLVHFPLPSIRSSHRAAEREATAAI